MNEKRSDRPLYYQLVKEVRIHAFFLLANWYDLLHFVYFSHISTEFDISKIMFHENSNINNANIFSIFTVTYKSK